MGVNIPKNARLIRNLLHGAQFQHDHLVHFYHLHALDWVDIVSALKADPKKTAALADSVSNAREGGAAYFSSVQQRLQTFVDSGQLGPFANAYWGHSAYQLPPEANLMASAHYIEALKLQARTARMHAVFGAKNPHLQSLCVGGVTCVKDLTPDRNRRVPLSLEGVPGIRQKRLRSRPVGRGLLLQGLGAPSAVPPTSWPGVNFPRPTTRWRAC